VRLVRKALARKLEKFARTGRRDLDRVFSKRSTNVITLVESSRLFASFHHTPQSPPLMHTPLQSSCLEHIKKNHGSLSIEPPRCKNAQSWRQVAFACEHGPLPFYPPCIRLAMHWTSARFRRAFLAATCGVIPLGDRESIAQTGLPTSCAWGSAEVSAHLVLKKDSMSTYSMTRGA
jgi:hypothetical protein